MVNLRVLEVFVRRLCVTAMVVFGTSVYAEDSQIVLYQTSFEMVQKDGRISWAAYSQADSMRTSMHVRLNGVNPFSLNNNTKGVV